MRTQALPTVAGLQPALRAVRLDCAARLISHLTHPPIIAVVSIVLAAAATATPQAWLLSAGYLALTLVVPLAYVLWQVKRGALTDVQLQRREQRLKPYLIALVCMAVGVCIFRIGNAPRVLQQVAIAGLGQMLVLFVVTLRWKISAHAASIAGLAVLGCRLLGPAGVLVCAAVPLVAWSRVRLGRHDAWQAVAGVCAGATIALAALSA
jgi:membrane-associated phospholipid phosphatase